MARVIIVGQAPGLRCKDSTFDGPGSGKRLAALAGLDLKDFLERFDRINLLGHRPGKSGKGDAFEIDAAMDRAAKLRAGWRGRKVVLAGRSVAAAFRLAPTAYEWFEPMELDPGFECAVMPHPSGVSRWWNDAANLEAARRFMQRLNVGYLAIPRAGKKATNGRPESFTPEQVAAALVASDGLPLQAAHLLHEETGIATSRQVVRGYCERYPALDEIRERCRQALGDIAEQNVLAAVRAGDPELSLKLLRSNAFRDRGYEPVFNGRLQLDGKVEHRHAHLHARLADVGLDLTRYSDDQLAAIEDFSGMLGGGGDTSSE